MFGSEICASSFWWIFPLLMMFLCFFMMRRLRGSRICGFATRSRNRPAAKDTQSAMDMLDQRYASGDIDKAEYEEKKRTLNDPIHNRRD